MLQRPQAQATLVPGRDHDWRSTVTGAAPADCVPVAATDPLYILYTSGTTGVPKGVVRDNGGHAVALQWSMTNVFATGPGEVFWAASDIGWTVGHSYIVYAPLLHGCTTVLYEGKPVGTPDPGAFWRVCAQHGVSVLFTAPTAFRAIKREDPKGASWRRTICRASACSFSPANDAIPTRSSGRRNAWACRSSITGGRPSLDGRRSPTASASAFSRSSPARRRARFPGSTSA